MNSQSSPVPAKSIRLVYVTVVNVGTADNGGALVCRQHIERLRKLPSVELTVCLIGTQRANAEGERYLAELGVSHKSFACSRGAKRALYPLGHWKFSFEKLALRSFWANEQFKEFAATSGADLFILDYLFTALFVSSLFELGRRVIMITLNPEAELYDGLRRLGRLPEDCSSSRIAVSRLNFFEKWVYRHVSHVVALSPNDLPKDRRVSASVIRPAFSSQFLGWQYSGKKTLGFVGGIAHYPNWLAMRWLCNDFAPVLARRDSGVRIQIVGASAEDVPQEWKKPNVEFLGKSREAVQECMLTCGLFIAPIENNYGSKIKILECLAYGTPILATREALAGLDDHRGLPLIALQDPGGAADLASRLLSDLESLVNLSTREGEIVEVLSARCAEDWRQTFAQVMAMPPKKPVVPLLNLPVLLWGRRGTGARRAKGERVNLARANAPDLFLEGFQDPAMLDNQPIRWIKGTGSIRVLKDHGPLPRKLRLECWDMPDDGPERLVVRVNRKIAVEIEAPGSQGRQTIPLSRRGRESDMLIEIQGETANDPLKRGVPLRHLQIHW